MKLLCCYDCRYLPPDDKTPCTKRNTMYRCGGKNGVWKDCNYYLVAKSSEVCPYFLKRKGSGI